MAKNFFSILKIECIYRYKLATFSEDSKMTDSYTCFYGHECIRYKTVVASH